MITIEGTGAVNASQFLTELEHATSHKVDEHTTPREAAEVVHDFTETWVDTHTPEARRGLETLLLALNTAGR